VEDEENECDLVQHSLVNTLKNRHQAVDVGAKIPAGHGSNWDHQCDDGWNAPCSEPGGSHTRMTDKNWPFALEECLEGKNQIKRQERTHTTSVGLPDENLESTTGSGPCPDVPRTRNEIYPTHADPAR
jgi:hypothetical protein